MPAPQYLSVQELNKLYDENPSKISNYADEVNSKIWDDAQGIYAIGVPIQLEGTTSTDKIDAFLISIERDGVIAVVEGGVEFFPRTSLIISPFSRKTDTTSITDDLDNLIDDYTLIYPKVDEKKTYQISYPPFLLKANSAKRKNISASEEVELELYFNGNDKVTKKYKTEGMVARSLAELMGGRNDTLGDYLGNDQLEVDKNLWIHLVFYNRDPRISDGSANPPSFATDNLLGKYKGADSKFFLQNGFNLTRNANQIYELDGTELLTKVENTTSPITPGNLYKISNFLEGKDPFIKLVDSKSVPVKKKTTSGTTVDDLNKAYQNLSTNFPEFNKDKIWNFKAKEYMINKPLDIELSNGQFEQIFLVSIEKDGVCAINGFYPRNELKGTPFLERNSLTVPYVSKDIERIGSEHICVPKIVVGNKNQNYKVTFPPFNFFSNPTNKIVADDEVASLSLNMKNLSLKYEKTVFKTNGLMLKALDLEVSKGETNILNYDSDVSKEKTKYMLLAYFNRSPQIGNTPIEGLAPGDAIKKLDTEIVINIAVPFDFDETDAETFHVNGKYLEEIFKRLPGQYIPLKLLADKTFSDPAGVPIVSKRASVDFGNIPQITPSKKPKGKTPPKKDLGEKTLSEWVDYHNNVLTEKIREAHKKMNEVNARDSEKKKILKEEVERLEKEREQLEEKIYQLYLDNLGIK